MRREGQGSASISAVVVFLSALLALGLMATILPPVSNVLSGFREGLRERGERGSELIRIYIHTANETELEPPIITIINGYDRESILTDYVVVARDGRVLAAGKMGGSLGGVRIPAGARIDLTPADFGLSYGTFAAIADEVKAIYVRTAEGNSFGSSYGPPPKISPDYQLNISQRSQHIIVIGSTTTRYNFTITGNLTLPTTGDALVVKNVILVDPNGYVRGGATAGSKWSDGSFNPNKIPDSVAALTKTTDVVSIGGYYVVPPFPKTYYNYDCFGVYSYCDTRPQYIEMVEFYPVEHYASGSPAVAVAYYARFGGEKQTVYNPDLGKTVTITAQRPVKVQVYPYGIPGAYTPTVVGSYSTYVATLGYSYTTYTTTTTTIIGGAFLKTTTTTETSTSTYITVIQTRVRSTRIVTPVSVWPEGGLIKSAPVFDIYRVSTQQSGACTITASGISPGWRTCSFTIRIPPKPNPAAIPTAIKELEYTVWISDSVCLLDPKVKVTGPWGAATLSQKSWSMSNLPVGDITFELNVYYWGYNCGAYRASYTAELSSRAIYEFFVASSATATATILTSDLRSQVKSAIVNGTLSGDAVAHLAGTVQQYQIVKVKAPIVVLNYIYGIAGSPPSSPPPPSSGGGGSGPGDAVVVPMVCEVNVEQLRRPSSDGFSSSSDRPVNSPGGPLPDFRVRTEVVEEVRRVVCRPVTSVRPR
jgi:hypothetical protein